MMVDDIQNIWKSLKCEWDAIYKGCCIYKPEEEWIVAIYILYFLLPKVDDIEDNALFPPKYI